MSGPLKGLEVIEMAGIGPGPLAGQLLADLGADVIVIDRAEAPADKTDVNRRGKRSVFLDLKSEEGRSTAQALINRAGIVIEGFRPGVMERLGLGPDDLDETVIFGRITGWGQDGPLSQSAGHDINYLGLTGALAAMGTVDNPPPPPLNLVADYGGGTMFLLLGILAAVFDDGAFPHLQSARRVEREPRVQPAGRGCAFLSLLPDQGRSVHVCRPARASVFCPAAGEGRAARRA